jgi:hypothetical protein
MFDFPGIFTYQMAGTALCGDRIGQAGVKFPDSIGWMARGTKGAVNVTALTVFSDNRITFFVRQFPN